MRRKQSSCSDSIFQTMTILGIDPGLNSTGWGIIKNVDFECSECKQVIQNETQKDVKCTFVDCGIFKTNAHDDLGIRLTFIYDSVLNLIKSYKPDKISMERVFVNINPASSEKLIMARTAAFLAIAKSGHKCVEFSPNEIKKTITGLGHSSKDLVKSTVQSILKVNTDENYYPKTADASDALAIALCLAFANSRK